MAERHAHGEGATGSLVLDRDLAALRLDQTPGDGQAEARSPAAVAASGRVAPVGDLEDPLELVRRDPPAGVDHRHRGRARLVAGLDRHLSAGRRVANGVVEQVA